MKSRTLGKLVLKATVIAVVGWITPRVYDLLTLKEGAIHLQAFSVGSAVELLWVVLMCGIGLGLYRFVGHLHRRPWMNILMLVILPAGIIYVHHIMIGSRYSIIYLDKQTITLSGRPYSESSTILVSNVSQVHMVNRNNEEDMELEFLMRSGETFKTCHVYGIDPSLVMRLRRLIQRMSLLGISITESNITAVRGD